MELIKQKIPAFLEKCLKGISLTSAHNIAVYCQFCGSEKNEFLDPRTERVVLLECECERRYSMLRDYIKSVAELVSQREEFALKAVAEVEAMQADRAKLREQNNRAVREPAMAGK